MRCYLCNSSNQHLFLFIKKHGYKYFKCLKCKLIQQIPTPKEKEIKRIYNSDKIYFIDEKKGLTIDDAIRIGLKEKLFYSLFKFYIKNKNIKILDVGAGTGTMLAFLKEKGFSNLDGIEISQWACNIAKKRFNLNLINDDINNTNFLLNNYYDFIIINHVVEHLRDPITVFKKLNRLLKPNGLLFLSTPNSSCLNSRIVKKKWKFYIPNEHIFLFNTISINYFLNKVGFEIIDIKKFSFNKQNYIFWFLQLITPILTDVLRHFIGKKEGLNNFETYKDGLIIVSRKIENVNNC